MKKSSMLDSRSPTLIPERRQILTIFKRFTAQGRKGGAGVGDGVDPNAEPGDAVGTEKYP